MYIYMCVCLMYVIYIYTVYGGNHLEVDTVEDEEKMAKSHQ